MSRTHFRVNLHSIFAWISRNSLLETGAIWSLSNSNGIRTHDHLVRNNYLAKVVVGSNPVAAT